MRSISSASTMATAHAVARPTMSAASTSRSSGGTSLESASPAHVGGRVEHDGRGHDRPGQAAAPDFVHAGDAVEAQPPQGVLDRAPRAWAGP